MTPPHTQPTIRLESQTKFTTVNSVPPRHTYRRKVRSTKEESDRPHGRPLYTPQTSRHVFQNTQETITSQYSPTHTCNQPEDSILDESTPKIDQNAKLNYILKSQ